VAERALASAGVVDPAIPTLRVVLDPRELGHHLRAVGPPPAEAPKDLQVRVLRHHAGKRCVVELTWEAGGESRSVIGKVYAKDRSDVYRLMQALRRAGLGSDPECSIPRPMAYLEELQLLLQEKVEGRPATESFLSDDEPRRTAAAERCARWLATFHAIAPRSGPSFPPSRHRVALQQWVGRLTALGPPIADQAGALFARLDAAASALSPIEPCTIHGDYTHHQVILAPGRTVTLDWDRHRLADPGDDVARFIVGLQRLALRCRGSMAALDGAADAFVRTYVASGRPDVVTRLAFHRAAICLEHAKHDVHKQGPGWPAKAAATLAEGLRALAQGS
jgi:aminoglycoside phosphotransferase (APT) family kinase protein